MTIFMDIDGVRIDIRKILREMQEFPAAAEVAVSEGGSSEVSIGFRSAVAGAADAMGEGTRRVVELLNSTQEAIRASVEELAAQDSSISDEVKTILSLLDSAAEQDGGTASDNGEFK
ncbi:hypothetical protein [Microbacterium sp.]|uniref:hypothetical protein n=1 Tax=Microbacterium sp. TaxID=51671 RepID=UPI003F9D25F5